ncbi:MAG: methionine/alanine import family NSS transporter small subunit [bacterium]
MTFPAVILMILLLAVVWGGFAYTLRLAMKKETEKTNS